MTVLRSLVILSIIMASYAYSEPARIHSFSTPPLMFNTPERRKQGCMGPSLGKLYDSGTRVDLVGEKGVCGATVAGLCTYDRFGGGHFKGSVLELDAGCPVSFSFAVVGADRSSVRVIAHREDKTPLPKSIELKARRLVQESFDRFTQRIQFPRQDFKSLPKVIKVGHVALLIYRSSPGRWTPASVVANDKVFPLDGHSHSGFIFFSVDDRLYLMSLTSWMGAAVQSVEIIDLSDGEPRRVFLSTDDPQ
jgi:hypothetical protein